MSADYIRRAICRRLCVRRKALYLVCHERESAAGIARSRRFNRCVKRQKIGLSSDAGDRFNDLAQVGNRGSQRNLTLLQGTLEKQLVGYVGRNFQDAMDVTVSI